MVAKKVVVVPDDEEKLPFYVLTGALYDWLKNIALILVPGIGALYAGLAQIWHWSNADKITGTCTVVGVFLGLFLKNSSNTYKKKEADVDGYVSKETFPDKSKGDRVVMKVR